ncbi:uncharacterized protein LOC124203539 [Daphnia pulex]|uniref:uncharacterized protein LOC124203539 n=1 Tax=Daphnia pulex TaxID=6669 RepID=UPI001EDD5629|nr:uncharacterized protein LOC124203539 [Daphnia pulex]
MWHLMWLTLSFVCCLSAINYVVAAPIDSAEEAARYLGRFGYLERGPQDSSYSESVSAESFRSAIEDFQSFAGLKITGKLDEATKELMNKPRCGVPDRIRPGSSRTRPKRFALEGSHWPKKKLTYKIKKYTPDMSPPVVDREIARAFEIWANVTDLAFVHVKNTSANVDIDILFAIGEHDGEHGNCDDPFIDGPGGTLAHAAHPINGGDAHFDESETWTLDSVKGTNLFQVATHEFGHSLGLEHTNNTAAVMYFAYEYRSDFKLDKDDIEGVQELYGQNQFSRKLALELKATLELLKTTVNNLEKKNIELRNDLIDTRTNLNKKLEDCVANSDRLGQELKVTAENFKKDLRTTSNDLKTTKTNLASTRTELNRTKSAFTDLATEFKARTSELVDIGKMPTSCWDLQRMGQRINGFFSVKGAKKMEMIYCNFFANQNDNQKWIGFADVKSAPVYFYVQRNWPFYNDSTPVPFDSALVNEGNAMNLTSGKFTAPRPGTYFFSFTGVARLESSSDVYFHSYIYLNGKRIGTSYVREDKAPVDQNSPFTLQSTLNLKKGDQVWVEIIYPNSETSLYDIRNFHLTHFTGFMLDEEIAASL